MDKYKIYTLETSYPLDIIYNKISQISEVEDSTFEIFPLSKNDELLTFKFSEKRILETSLLDINGNEQTIEYLQIESFEFQIFQKINTLKLLLINPNRSLKFFKQTLAEILDYHIAIVDEQIDPLLWLTKIENDNNQKFQINSIEVKDIIFNSKISGNLTL